MKKMTILLSVMFSLCASLTSMGAIKGEEVTYELQGVKMNGYVSYDESLKGSLPVVLVVHEWWGCNQFAREQAEKIAALGYFAVAVDMYGDYKMANNPQQAMALSGVLYNDAQLAFDRMTAAVQYVSKYPQANTKNVSAIGYCFGGSMVLNAAKMGMDLKAAVSFHGGLQGVPAQKGKTKAQILVCHGGADPFVPQADVDAFRKNLDETATSYDFKVYADATHAFTNPYSTEAGKRFGLPIAYNEKASNDAWTDMKAFFAKHITK